MTAAATGAMTGLGVALALLLTAFWLWNGNLKLKRLSAKIAALRSAGDGGLPASANDDDATEAVAETEASSADGRMNPAARELSPHG